MQARKFSPHPSLYFPDGNIAVMASKSFTECIVFRVHQSILSRASPIFQDLFALGTTTGSEVYDGLPVIFLQDGAEQVESLFRFFYREG
jgi:hypothetical protein